MPSKNIIRVSEFEKLYYSEQKPFKQKHWEALCRYLENVNSKEEKRMEYFRILNKGIQFTNYVGVIQAGNLTIEVLPKVDKAATTAANDNVDALEKTEAATKQQWHGALLQMLKECRLLQVNHVDYANLNLRSNSILDIYLQLFLTETEKLLHEGLLEKYRQNEGNQTALKGQLLFQKQMAYNSTHQERSYVRYTEYNRNNIYNQIIYKTLRLIQKLSNSPHLLDKTGKLLLDFPEVSPCTVNAETFSRLAFDRKTVRYTEALLISKMLLLNYRPDITGGTENVMAVLFDMNKLWEEFVYRRLRKEAANSSITVHRQESQDFWKASHLPTAKKIRPDIAIRKGIETIIVDTKWKVMEDLVPGDDDLKQIFVYNLFWNCDKSILLYPSLVPNSGEGNYSSFQQGIKPVNKCGVIMVSIFDEEQKLDRNFGANVLDKIFTAAR